MLKNCWKKFKKLMKKDWSAGAGVMCDLLKLGVRTCVCAHLNLDVRGACVRPKKRSQLTPNIACKLEGKRKQFDMDFTCLAFLHPIISFWETRDLLPLTTKKKHCETQNINHLMYVLIHIYVCFIFYVHTGFENRERCPQLVKCRFTYYLDFYYLFLFVYLLF